MGLAWLSELIFIHFPELGTSLSEQNWSSVSKGDGGNDVDDGSVVSIVALKKSMSSTQIYFIKFRSIYANI